jgi:apolipoprotein N-acyltransferase
LNLPNSLRASAAIAAIAGVAGALAPFGWEPLGWWPLALLCHALFFLLLTRTRSGREAAIVGAAFGLCLHVAGHGWLFDSMVRRTGMGAMWAAVGMVVLLVYLTVFTAIPALAWRAVTGLRLRSTHGGLLEALAFAALMTLGELARSLPFNGFSSLSLGYALIDTPFVGMAPVIGVYGVSLIGFAVAALAAAAIDAGKAQRLHIALAGLAMGLACVGAQRLEWVEPAGTSLRVRLVQGNVAQEKKFDAAYQREQVRQYGLLLQSGQGEKVDLVVTPETAYPMFLNELPADTLRELQGFAKASGTHLLLGIATLGADDSGHNSMIHIAGDRDELTQYDKVELMPFGEYSPAGFGWFTAQMHIALKDLKPGLSGQLPFDVRGQRIGTLICHEDLSSRQARAWVGGEPGATVLVNPSNLAWFADSIALPQRHQLIRMRAVESGRPLLRAANTGISSVIDHRGEVVASLAIGSSGAVAARVQGMQGLTPYVRWGDLPVLVIVLALVGAAGWQRRGRPERLGAIHPGVARSISE